VFVCLELQCDKVSCMNRSGEEDWTTHDTITALVTHSKPALWKFHWPESVQCTVHCNHKWSVCMQTNPIINFVTFALLYFASGNTKFKLR